MGSLPRIAPLLLVLMLAGCSGKAGRVTMRLEPTWQGVVLVEGAAPTVHVINAGPGAVVLDVGGVSASERVRLDRDGEHTARLEGDVRVAAENTDDEEAMLEIRAVRYRRIVIERLPSVPDP